MRDILAEIWSTARRNKLRTALTGFAVAWGIFMIIFLLGAGNGLINAQMDSQGRFLSNSMIVYGGRTSKAYNGLQEGRTVSLLDKDMNTTRTNFKSNIDDVGAELETSGVTISLGQNYFNGTLTGVYPNHIQITKREILYGRFINDIDIKEQRKVLVLSQDNAKELLKNYQDLIGKYVNVGNFSFQVVGIYKQDQSQMNKDVFSSFSTIKTIYNRGDSIGNIEYSFHGLPTKADNDRFEKQYRRKINSNHLAAPDDESAVWLWNRYTQSMQMNQGIGIIRTALWVVGLFTLLSGIVGVSNIMLITVKERTREFGIRKAIGASPASILKLIIVESVIITTIFGYTGMVLGVAANEYMDATIGHTQIDTGLFKATMFLNPTVGLDVCIEATLVIIIAGTIAGLIPARKAAKIRPIEALKAE
ncbi:ABC transporter permease [Xylanibacter oryzae]|uniref:ABC transporter permease n=1 Tax=Xylanibacter oryzae TaxID=185293 RepID=UPI0004B1B5C4|nr:ABC transporter permease [Xylanibacter oryzae]